MKTTALQSLSWNAAECCIKALTSNFVSSITLVISSKTGSYDQIFWHQALGLCTERIYRRGKWIHENAPTPSHPIASGQTPIISSWLILQLIRSTIYRMLVKWVVCELGRWFYGQYMQYFRLHYTQILNAGLF